jgi:prepilin-type N-terminal cleavage/methylation domain-containing protein
MNHYRKAFNTPQGRARGFSLVELVIVVAIVLIIVAIVIPNVLLAVTNLKLRASAGDLSGLIQQARSLSAKNNAPFVVLYGTRNGAQIAYIRDSRNGLGGGYATGEPAAEFSGTTVPAAGAPTGSSGQPPPYVLPGDTGAGSYDNTSTLGYTGRGLPCNYDTTTTPATCSTPPAKYFVYYLTDTRTTQPGWAGVVVTKSGRCKIVIWNGDTTVPQWN